MVAKMFAQQIGSIGSRLARLHWGQAPRGERLEGKETKMYYRMADTLRRGFAACLLCLSMAVCQTAGAQSINWVLLSKYDTGYRPSVSLSGTNVVEVHQDGSGNNQLWYRTGTISNGKIIWSPPVNYDNGYTPSVSLDGTTVVETHEDGAYSGGLYYRVGQLLAGHLYWYASYKHDTGYYPSISLSRGNVVEVHQDGRPYYNGLWYKTGTVNGSGKILWNSTNQYDNGYNPSVSISGNNIVEAHLDGGASGNLFYHTGTLSNGQVNWSGSKWYDWGFQPSITLSDNKFVEVHRDGRLTTYYLWYHMGTLSNGQLNWGPPTLYEYNGGWPSVSLSGTTLVAVHVSINDLWARLGYEELTLKVP
jgi:hypothetical protein